VNRFRLVGCAFILALGTSLLARAAPPTEKFELRDGDRVAFLGNTFFEREQAYSYLETLLASRFPDRSVTFRNVAWSGDTVFGHARAAFDTPEQGFERLLKVTREVKPTVLFISYGMGESFEGDAGLPAFKTGLARLLDRLKDLNARTVLVSPIRHEELAPPYPSPERHNRDLRRYVDVLKQASDQRGFWFVNLYELLGDGMKASPAYPLTDNGIHPSAYGYWKAAQAIEQALGYAPRGWTITLDASAPKAESRGVEVGAVTRQAKAITLAVPHDLLPVPPAPPIDARYVVVRPEAKRILAIKGLPEGHWLVRDGDAVLAAASADEWDKGIELIRSAQSDQAEKLRQVAVLKNEQFFNQWRPANETYLFGFRKNEQGQNAKEIPQFEQPIAEKEAQMAKLRAVAPYTLTVQREDE
jgi:lysophospholipase L1-like esterase